LTIIKNADGILLTFPKAHV